MYPNSGSSHTARGGSATAGNTSATSSVEWYAAQPSLFSKCFHFTVIFRPVKIQKSYCSMSGDYGAYRTSGVLSVTRETWIMFAEWAGA